MSLHISDDIRTALLADASITALLGTWNGAPAVFTRRPPPNNAPYPQIIVNPVDVNDMDALVSRRSIVEMDIAIYGQKSSDTRSVENLGLLVRSLFHRQRFSITPSGVSVVQIVCRGPLVGPTDDTNLLVRIVILRVTLKE